MKRAFKITAVAFTLIFISRTISMIILTKQIGIFVGWSGEAMQLTYFCLAVALTSWACMIAADRFAYAKGSRTN